MTKETSIEEGNKIIAEFMDFKEDLYPANKWYDYNGLHCWHRRDDIIVFRHKEKKSFIYPEYHSSWDWLMPVVEKIEDLGAIVQIGNKRNGNPVGIFYDSIETPITHEESESKIISTWQAVIQFIQWYNKNTQQ